MRIRILSLLTALQVLAVAASAQRDTTATIKSIGARKPPAAKPAPRRAPPGRAPRRSEMSTRR